MYCKQMVGRTIFTSASQYVLSPFATHFFWGWLRFFSNSLRLVRPCKGHGGVRLPAAIALRDHSKIPQTKGMAVIGVTIAPECGHFHLILLLQLLTPHIGIYWLCLYALLGGRPAHLILMVGAFLVSTGLLYIQEVCLTKPSSFSLSRYRSFKVYMSMT